MRYFSILLVSWLLTACSPAQRSIGDTLSLATFGQSDVTVNDQRIRELPYSSLYASIDGGPQIFVVAAFAEGDHVKWLTSDRVLLVTQNGRLVKTLGYHDNLLETTDLQHDPLLNAPKIIDGSRWVRTLSWTEKQQYRSASANSIFHIQAPQALTIAGVTQTYQVVEEQVDIAATNTHYRNRFWFDPATGVVRKADQFLGPDFTPVTLTILKP